MTNITRNFAAFAAAGLLAITLGCASTSKQEGTGAYVDDTVITTKVKAAMLADPETKVLQANRAVEVTRGVAGVTTVKNDMRIR